MPKDILGQMMVESGTISPEQLNDAMARQKISGERLGQTLVESGAASPDQVQKHLAQQLGLPYCELAKMEIPPEAIKAVPLAVLTMTRAIPIGLQNGSITLAMANPLDFSAIEAVQFATGLTVRRAVAREDDIIHAVEKHYGITVKDLIADIATQAAESGDEESYFIHDLNAMAREPTLVNLVNLILTEAIQQRASDVHIEPFEKDLKIKYRIDGVLHEIPPPPKHMQPAIISRLKIMATMDIAERFVPQDGHIRLNLPDRVVDIRVATLPTVFGESMVLRLLDRTTTITELETLGMPGETLTRFCELLKAPYGILLVTGPTGCGKTTTLYAAMSRIFTPTRKFITIEDPVEYQLPGVVQIPVRPKRGMGFANGLRSIVRQDPDVIMVGEIRDVETADIAIRAALTGHLVFSTLHTNDSAGAVTRLVDMGVEPFLVASAVDGILAQRLVRRLCPACRRPLPAPPMLLREFKMPDDEAHRVDRIYEPAGCDQCHNWGFIGRVGIFELLAMTTEIHNLVLERASSNAIKAAAARAMETMKQDGFNKMRDGVTTAEEVLQATKKDVMD